LAWTVEFLVSAQRQLEKLDRSTQQRITTFFHQRVLKADDPRQLAKTLRGDKGGLWRFRIGDYRAICKIEEEHLIVLVLDVGHRREIYR
jgi:mRNA interferase RelE/StbE